MTIRLPRPSARGSILLTQQDVQAQLTCLAGIDRWLPIGYSAITRTS
jgi:hypothetical protein